MLHARWREELISSNIMQASESETHRVAVTLYFGTGLRLFVVLNV